MVEHGTHFGLADKSVTDVILFNTLFTEKLVAVRTQIDRSWEMITSK
jgi:hypothetical protein